MGRNVHTAGGQQALGKEEGSVGPGLEETPGGPGWAPPAPPVPNGLQYFLWGSVGFQNPFLSDYQWNPADFQLEHDTASESSRHAFSTCDQDRIFIARHFPQEVVRLNTLQTEKKKKKKKTLQTEHNKIL